MFHIDIGFCTYLASSMVFWLHHGFCLCPCDQYCHDIVQLPISVDAQEFRAKWLGLSQHLTRSKAHYPIKCTYYWQLETPCHFVILLALLVLYPLFCYQVITSQVQLFFSALIICSLMVVLSKNLRINSATINHTDFKHFFCYIRAPKFIVIINNWWSMWQMWQHASTDILLTFCVLSLTVVTTDICGPILNLVSALENPWYTWEVCGLFW